MGSTSQRERPSSHSPPSSSLHRSRPLGLPSPFASRLPSGARSASFWSSGSSLHSVSLSSPTPPPPPASSAASSPSSSGPPSTSQSSEASHTSPRLSSISPSSPAVTSSRLPDTTAAGTTISLKRQRIIKK